MNLKTRVSRNLARELRWRADAMGFLAEWHGKVFFLWLLFYLALNDAVGERFRRFYTSGSLVLPFPSTSEPLEMSWLEKVFGASGNDGILAVLAFLAAFYVAQWLSGWLFALLVVHPLSGEGVRPDSFLMKGFTWIFEPEKREQYDRLNEMKGLARIVVEVLAALILGALAFALAFVYASRFDVGPFLGPLFSYAAGAFAGGFVYIVVSYYFQEEVAVLRGTRVQPLFWVWLKSIYRKRGRSDWFWWGGVWYPFEAGVRSMVAVGAQGSGKSVLITLWLRSVVPQMMRRDSDQRMIYYDAKGDAFSMFADMGVNTSEEAGKIITLNPLDARSYVWDMAADLTDLGDSLNELALLFVPPPKSSEPFWTDSARSILKSIIKRFVLDRQPWELRDLLAAMRSIDRMRALLSSDPATLHILEKCLSTTAEVTSKGVDMTLYAAIERFEPLAAYWHRTLKKEPTRKMSLREWLGLTGTKNAPILVLGIGDPGGAVDSLNRLVVQRLRQLIVKDQRDDPKRRTYFVFDELRTAGKLGLEPILSRGRSKGAVVVIGFNDKSGLDDEYGRNIGEEIPGLCGLRVFMGLASNTTADWVSNEVGGQEVFVDGKRDKRLAIMPSEFTDAHSFPMPDRDTGQGITFVGKSAVYGAYKGYLSPRRFVPKIQRAEWVSDLEQRPQFEEVFTDWAPHEEARFLKRPVRMLDDTERVQANGYERFAPRPAGTLEPRLEPQLPAPQQDISPRTAAVDAAERLKRKRGGRGSGAA